MNSIGNVISITDSGFIQNIQEFFSGNYINESFYLLADNDSKINPKIYKILTQASLLRPDIDLFYGDEAIHHIDSRGSRYIHKPSFDLIQLISQDYIRWPFFINGKTLNLLINKLRTYKSLSTYEILLASISVGSKIERITELFVSRFKDVSIFSNIHRASAIQKFIVGKLGEYYVIDGIVENTLQLKKKFNTYPKVTLIIPTCQSFDVKDSSKPYIVKLLDSLVHSSWPIDKIKIIIGDDIASDKIYKKKWPFKIERIVTKNNESFNYAKKMNLLWRHAATDYVIFMNDDIIVGKSDWIEALICFSSRHNVGGVGALLLYPDGNIQHAGMFIGVHGPCTHPFVNLPKKTKTYLNWSSVHRECSSVTGAVFATRKKILEEINGFDEQFTLDFNDVDMCLRMHMLGYKIIYTPYSELTHYESKSRKANKYSGYQLANFIERWRYVIDSDPYYHPQLKLISSTVVSDP